MSSLDPVTLLPGMLPISREEDGDLIAEVLWIDRYGNVQLNVDDDELSALGDPVSIAIGDKTRVVRRADAYASVKPGEIGIVIDAYGLVSLAADRAVGRRSAAGASRRRRALVGYRMIDAAGSAINVEL